MESLLPVPRILPKDDSYKVYILKIYSPNSNGNVNLFKYNLSLKYCENYLLTLSCLRRYSLSGMYSSVSPFSRNVSTCL